MDYATKKIENNNWHDRDVQWIKADIEKYPELAFSPQGPT